MSKCYIFVNGDLGDIDFLKDEVTADDHIIAVDGGVDTVLSLGLEPNIVVGDFDSAVKLPEQVKNTEILKKTAFDVDGVEYIKYPHEKDYLDTELALMEAFGKEFTQIVLVNILGNEIDHMLGVIFLLLKPQYKDENIVIRSANQEIRYFDKSFEISGTVGKKISLIPILENTEVAKTNGLKYDPSKYEMSIMANTGISNEFTQEKASVELISGGFLVIKHL